ncbi:MAG: fibronectin type III domain-containing protein, partial [Candidatus Sungbacteria bacterium]|nr:fibronectin type III domain-containing protein [Candidatus Sungbacteria bacterium]
TKSADVTVNMNNPSYCATTDTTPPTVPTNLTATVISSSEIDLSWTASTDNVGVTKYKIFRDGVKIATEPTATTHKNTGLTPNTTYRYTVSARDAAGNESAKTAAVTGKTMTANTTEKKRVKVLAIVKVRSNPATSATSLGTATVGTLGTVRCDLTTQTCPATANGYTWWYIDWDNASLSTGWSVEGDEQSDFLSFSDPAPIIGTDGSLRVRIPAGTIGQTIHQKGGVELPILVLGDSGTAVTLSTPNLAYGLESHFIKGVNSDTTLEEGNNCTSPCVASFYVVPQLDNCNWALGLTCGVRVAASVNGTEKTTSPYLNFKTNTGTWQFGSEPIFLNSADQIFYGPIDTPVRIVALELDRITGSYPTLYLDGLGFETGDKANTLTITNPNGDVLFTKKMGAPYSYNDWKAKLLTLVKTNYHLGSDYTMFPSGTLIIEMRESVGLNVFDKGNKITVSNIKGSHTVTLGVAAPPPPPPPPPLPPFGPQPITTGFKIFSTNSCYVDPQGPLKGQEKLCPGYRDRADFSTGGSYTVIAGITGGKTGVVFDIYSNNKTTLLGTLTPFFTDGIGELYCVSESNTGGGGCKAAFVLPVPSDWAPGTYWVRARNTDGTVSNYAAVVVSSWNQLPASLDGSNANWVDGVTILNSLVGFTATQGRTYTIDVYGWNFQDGAKIVLCPHGRSSTLSDPGQPVLPGVCATKIEVTATKLGLGHLQTTYTIPTDLNLGGYITFVKNPGGELGYGGNLINTYYGNQNVPDDPKISVEPVSGSAGTTFTFKNDCSYSSPGHAWLFGGNFSSVIVKVDQIAQVGNVCGFSLKTGSTIQAIELDG